MGIKKDLNIKFYYPSASHKARCFNVNWSINILSNLLVACSIVLLRLAFLADPDLGVSEKGVFIIGIVVIPHGYIITLYIDVHSPAWELHSV